MLSGVRTVFAFGGERIEVDRYKRLLLPAENAARRKGLYASIGDAVTRILYFLSCALASWYGAQWVIEDRDKVDKAYTTAVLIIVSYNHHKHKIFYRAIPVYEETNISFKLTNLNQLNIHRYFYIS